MCTSCFFSCFCGRGHPDQPGGWTLRPHVHPHHHFHVRRVQPRHRRLVQPQLLPRRSDSATHLVCVPCGRGRRGARAAQLVRTSVCTAQDVVSEVPHPVFCTVPPAPPRVVFRGFWVDGVALCCWLCCCACQSVAQQSGNPPQAASCPPCLRSSCVPPSLCLQHTQRHHGRRPSAPHHLEVGSDPHVHRRGVGPVRLASETVCLWARLVAPCETPGC